MKKLSIIVIAFILPLLGLLTSVNAGVQSRKSAVQYYQHDAQKGRKLLESKLDRTLEVIWNEHNSTPTFVGGKLTPAGYSTSPDKSIDGIRFISENSEMFGLREPSKELEVISAVTDDLSMTHVKYQQTLNGIKIFQNQLIVHFNSDGSIESVNGRYFPTPTIVTIPALSADAAILNAEKSLNGYTATSRSAELMIYAKGVQLFLVYAVKLPSYEKPKMVIFIDAQNGSIIKIDDGIRYDGPAVGTGIGLKGTSRSIHTYLAGGTYYMIDASLPMFVAPIDSFKGVIDTYDALNDTAGNGYSKAVRVVDPNNDNNFNDNQRLKAAVDAHYFSREVYSIYKSRYNRNSFDNLGGTLINVLHYNINYNNAFWNGSFMTYGDGDGSRYSNLAGGFDVIAHEMTHGVTEKTANLIYELQSGALNEAVSDIFAVIADSSNWLLGEDVYTPSIAGDALRNIQDPHNGQTINDPDWQPAHMNEFVVLANDDKHDNGGVHINSGIINKSFYNLATAIGRTKGGLIWYRALTVYLTNNSQFVDARNACLSAAKDLFGNGSAEYTAVADAFTAVGIGPNSVTTYNLVYDDGAPSTGVYEDLANWELAVRFTPPVPKVTISNVKVYISGTNAGTGQFTLKMYQANAANNLPGTPIITPYPYSPAAVGWQSFDITGVTVSGDFYVSAKYDGINKPNIGADVPPGNQKTYEYDGAVWAKLGAPNDYTLFMRATVSSTTAVAEIDTRVPDKYELLQNYPNPFNPSTVIRYALPVSQNLRLAIYDIDGKRIADLVDNFQNSGSYLVTWNGKNNAGESVAGGIYFYRLETNNYSQTKKLLLMK
jgi:bacillolysin/thermolysin